VAAGFPPGALRQAVDDADVVVLVGGSNLFDTGTALGLSTVRLLQLSLPGFAGARRGRRVWLLGHTLGPFRVRAGRALAAALLSRAERVVVRESESARLATQLGSVAPIVATDMAMDVSPRLTARVHDLLRRNVLLDRSFAVVTVRRAPYDEASVDDRLERELVRGVAAILHDELVDAVVIVAHVLGPTAVEDDRVASRRLRDRAAAHIGPHRLRLIEDDLAPDELAALYGAAQFVIGERFHSVLLALGAGTPAYAISYFTKKASGMMADLELGEFHCELGNVDGEHMADGARALCAADTRRRVHEAAARARDRLQAALP
jgi:polysaccharide pyruvyl transferase WcaK-like protein